MKSTNTQITGKQPIIINDNLDQHVHSTNEKTTITLESGKNTTTLNPGYMVPIMFKEVLAGEYIKEWHIDNLTRLIAPLVPTLDRSYINIQAYFVPHTRVWIDAEKALAGKDNTITTLPTTIIGVTNTQYSTFNRMIISRYGIPYKAGATTINVLLPRGYRAITNDFIINKDYGVKKTEWNETTPTTAEKNAVIGFNIGSTTPIDGNSSNHYLLEKAQTRKGYLTNIKKNMAMPMNDLDEAGYEISNHLDWQTKFQDMKQRADNANKNDWDIIAEMGGTQPVKTDRVEFLGQVDYELNFQQITQTAPEIDNSSPLGTTGSFSFTKAQGTLFSHKKFLQHGFIHILLSVGIDNYTENGTPKELLKTQVNDIYRPGLAKKEIQLLMKQEIFNVPGTSGSAAYQPAWAEYKRLPSFVSGQMQTQTLDATTLPQGETDNEYLPVSNSQWHNFKVSPNTPVISDINYFRDTYGVASVFARNNILTPTIAGNTGAWKVQPLLNMSEHKVTVQLPIESSTLSSSTKAEITR